VFPGNVRGAGRRVVGIWVIGEKVAREGGFGEKVGIWAKVQV